MPAHSKLLDDGAVLIETVTRASVDGKPGDSPLDDVTIHDGFYRIMQYDDDGNELDALSDDYKLTGLAMKSVPQLTAGAEWMFTRQWGLLENGFTIAPKVNPDGDSYFGGSVEIPKSDHRLATTSYGTCQIWQVRCDESRTYRRKDGSTETVYYFSIQTYDPSMNSRGAWRTSAEDQKLRLALHGAAWYYPSNPLELYQLLPLGVVHPIVTGPGRITA